MKTQLFNIQTKVHASPYASQEIAEVHITAAKSTRSAIWELVTNDKLNPGVARYDGGAPTIVTLKPYPGYDGELVANMAYALALVAEVRDWTDLFVMSVTDLAGDRVSIEGFVPDMAIVNGFGRLFLQWKAPASLRTMVDHLRGLDTYKVALWYDDAIGCYRRADPKVQAKIGKMFDLVETFAKVAREISKVMARKQLVLEAKIRIFEALITSEATKNEVFRGYLEVREAIVDEEARLLAEGDVHLTMFDRVQDELIPAIRKATPPMPVVAK